MKRSWFFVCVVAYLYGCGSKSDSSGQKTSDFTGNPQIFPTLAEPEDLSTDLLASSFLLRGTGTGTVRALFYSAEGTGRKIIGSLKDPHAPLNYPVGARLVMLYSSPELGSLSRADIFSCCGIRSDTRIQKFKNGVWGVSNFYVAPDSKSPMLFTFGQDVYYLKTNLKNGLRNIRREISDLIGDSSGKLGLSEGQKEALSLEVSRILKANLLSDLKSR